MSRDAAQNLDRLAQVDAAREALDCHDPDSVWTSERLRTVALSVIVARLAESVDGTVFDAACREAELACVALVADPDAGLVAALTPSGQPSDVSA